HKIITAENPILRRKAKKIHRFDPSIQKLADEMFETMHAAHGVGLAAPQIAQSIRLFVAEFEDRKVAMANPEIVKAEGEVLGVASNKNRGGDQSPPLFLLLSQHGDRLFPECAFAAWAHIKPLFIAIMQFTHKVVQVADATACGI